MLDKNTPKVIPDEVQQEVARQINGAISFWRGGIRAFVERHNDEMERQDREFEETRAEIKEKFKRGAKQTNGFIV